MAHTPGPWAVDRSVMSAINAGTKHIALVNFYKCKDSSIRIDEDEHDANARLIATSPDLLQACEDLLSLIDEHGDRIMEAHATRLMAARATVAKAKRLK